MDKRMSDWVRVSEVYEIFEKEETQTKRRIALTSNSYFFSSSVSAVKPSVTNSNTYFRLQ